jgi:hypothetical protein
MRELLLALADAALSVVNPLLTWCREHCCLMQKA